LDLDTGQVETVSHALLREAGDSGDEGRIFLHGRSTNGRLPSEFEVHEWAIMHDFSRSVESDIIREDLLNPIHGPGALRSFKDTLQRQSIESSWFAFRTEALKQLALGWCEENQILCE
jgi:hypothetical protein